MWLLGKELISSRLLLAIWSSIKKCWFENNNFLQEEIKVFVIGLIKWLNNDLINALAILSMVLKVTDGID